MFAPLPLLGISDVWQLVVATMVFLMLPGPGTFCVLTCTARNGLRGGFASVAGLMLADGMLMFLAAAGVAALLKANPLAFRAMQFAGAAYLAWLGVKLLLAPLGRAAVRLEQRLAGPRQHDDGHRLAIHVNGSRLDETLFGE